MRENPATTIFIYEIAQLAKQAFELAFIPRNILSGFRSTEICPLSPNIFSNDDFTSSAITDRLPLSSITNLNWSRVKLEEKSLPGKGLDDVNQLFSTSFVPWPNLFQPKVT